MKIAINNFFNKILELSHFPKNSSFATSLLIIFNLIVFLNISGPLRARDVNLDEIYIKESKNLKKLMLEKIEVYRKTGALLIDKQVVFAGWISGDEIIYIKENNRIQTNSVFKFNLKNRRTIELCTVQGVVTFARVSSNGKYYVIKRLIMTTGIVPHGEMIIVNTKSGKMSVRKSPFAFFDFSIPDEGGSVIVEKDIGFVEISLDTWIQTDLLKKGDYNDIVNSNNPSSAYLSPDRQKILVLNGSGGHYRAKIISNNGNIFLKEVSSSSEIFWLDNFRVVYRTGNAGNFSVAIYDMTNRKVKYLIKDSYNTNIIYSINSGTLSYLKEEIIHLYNHSENKIINTGIEGEDVCVAPSGRFISLLYKNLFVVNTGIIEKKHIELERSWKAILSIYKDITNKKKEFENEYSQYYLDRKIEVYNNLIEGNVN